MQNWASVPRSVANRIESMIESGELAEGARLPSQRHLSSGFGVSRTSLREALSLLEASGVLRTEPGRGTFVRAAPAKPGPVQRADANGTALTVWSFPAGTTYTKLEVCRFRHLIEGQSGRLAAMRITDQQVELLERNLSTFKNQTRAMDLEASAVTDFEFHQLIVQFAGVKLFTDLHLACRELVMLAVKMPRAQYNRAWEPVVEHERILEALKRRDPDEARYYMQSHIVRTADRLGILLADDLV
jgi:GntR family transcriptional regulator, transcriptional repressor for pyruvate dehydrogenase complex